MKKITLLGCSALIIAGLLTPLAAKPMPRVSVIDIPAVSEGFSIHNLFQSNMVIQRNKPINLWGWATPGEKITITFAGSTQTVVAAQNRKWNITFPPKPASSKPVDILIKGKNKTLTLKNILIGDVWILGGQSNMEFPLHKVENGNLEIASANFSNIRILTIPNASSPKPIHAFPRLHEWSSWSKRHFRKGDWDVCSPKTVRELSAIGYTFARRIHMTTQIPIGIIDVSVGGTTIETWTPIDVVRQSKSTHIKQMINKWDQKVQDWDGAKDLEKQVAHYQNRINQLKQAGKPIPPNFKKPTQQKPGPAHDRNFPGNYFSGMISPLTGLNVKGIIFHQGYNNCFDGTQGAKMYRDLFPKLITAWRTAFNDPQLPFGILSLCTAGKKQNLQNYSSLMGDTGPFIREAQYQTFLEFYKAGDKNIGFTSTYDFRRRWYHPQLKIPVGERAARWALASQYGQEKMFGWKPPMVVDMKTEDGKIMLHMDVTARATDDGGTTEGFAIAGKDRKFHPAKAEFLVIGKGRRGRPKVNDKIIVLTSPMVPKPIHYRYAWARNPMGNVNVKGIPLPTQRSDNWPLEEAFIDGQIKTLKGGQINNALSKQDKERAVQQAHKTIKTK